MLELNAVNAFYGKSHILFDVALRIDEGELVTILGRNGAGKTTTVSSILGLVPRIEGSIRFNGTELVGLESHAIANRGLCLVPEQRDIFQILTVEENLLLAHRKGSPWDLQAVYALFPRLRERRRNGGGQLSGGEQQMLAIARALVNNPSLLLLDEPTEGLAPIIVQEIVNILQTIKQSGMPILLIEQNLRVCEILADRHYVMEQGQIIYESDAASFSSSDADVIKQKYLAV